MREGIYKGVVANCLVNHYYKVAHVFTRWFLKGIQENSKSLQDDAKSSQMFPKTPPGGLQEDSESSQDALKRPPRASKRS